MSRFIQAQEYDTGGLSVVEDIRKLKKTIGIKQTLKAVQKDKVVKVYFAEDAEKRVINNLLDFCKEKNIDIQYIESMQTLGKACGIDVGASAVGILNEE